MKRVFWITLLCLWVLYESPVLHSQAPHRVSFQWNFTGAEGYGVYRGVNTVDLQQLAIVTVTDYTDMTVRGGMVYYYAVTSMVLSDGYESVKSDVTSVRIPVDNSGGGGCNR